MQAKGNIKFTDNTGASFGVKQIDNKMRVDSMPYPFDVSEGLVAGSIPFCKMGYNPDIGAAEEDVWDNGGVYVPPVAATQMEIISTSAQDAAGNNGVRSVTIYYLTNAFVQKSETIALTGLVAAPTINNDIYRVNYFQAETVGPTGSAVGTITLRNVAGAPKPIYGVISIGYTRARTLFYTVPAGKILYITNIVVSTGSSAGQRTVRFTTRATYDILAAAVRNFYLPFSELALQDQPFERELELPTRFPAGVDLKISAISPDGSTVCTASIEGWLATA